MSMSRESRVESRGSTAKESRFTAWAAEQRRLRAAESAGPDPGQILLSSALQEFFATLEARRLKPRTMEGYRQSAWSLLTFLGCDPPRRDLRDDLGAEWLNWLRNTPPQQAVPWTLPDDFQAAGVSQVLARRRAGKGTTAVARCPRRKEGTNGRLWRHGAPLLRWLGLPTALPKDQRPRGKRGFVVVATSEEIAAWWRGYLTNPPLPITLPSGRVLEPATPAQRRRVVLLQAFLLLTGLRLGEALRAQQDDAQGHWLLVGLGKTDTPRIIYVSAQALGIAAELRRRELRQLNFFGDRLLGWRYTVSTWDHLVTRCGPCLVAKPQQEMRKRLSTWMRSEKKEIDAERAQLGHGGGADVVFSHYLDSLAGLPDLLEQWTLPGLDLSPEARGPSSQPQASSLKPQAFVWPAPIQAERGRPMRLMRQLNELIDYRA